MKSDPKDCLYCQNNETLHNLMIEIAPLSVSRVFLFKEQTYRGRCLVAYKDHVNDLFELSDEERNAFMADVARVTRAMDKAFHPEKINYGAYSDKLFPDSSEIHLHNQVRPHTWEPDENAGEKVCHYMLRNLFVKGGISRND